jgi:endoglucanase
MRLLKELSEAHGVPGREDEVRNILERELSEFCDVKVDTMGNLIGQKGSGGKKVMLAAHMDEIGLMVKHIDEKGFIRFTTLGGFYDPTLLNQRVYVHSDNGPLRGVIGSKPPHLMEEKERERPVKYRDMFIDVGAKSRKDTERLGISVGNFITLERSFTTLGKGFITGKAFDNRLGCYAMIEVAKSIKGNFTLYAVGTAQEEVGLKGARTSAYRINPDIAIVIDVTTTGDHPGIKEEESSVKLGGGPVITIVDARGRGVITHSEVKNLLIKTAGEHKIPYQLEVGEGGTTDATAIQLTREGIPSGVVSIPARYIHTPVSVASVIDVENCIKLLTRTLERI